MRPPKPRKPVRWGTSPCYRGTQSKCRRGFPCTEFPEICRDLDENILGWFFVINFPNNSIGTLLDTWRTDTNSSTHQLEAFARVVIEITSDVSADNEYLLTRQIQIG